MTGLQRADHETFATAAAHTLAYLDVGSVAVEHEVTAFERKKLGTAQTRSGEQLKHQPVRSLDRRDDELHRLDRLAVVAFDAREWPRAPLVVCGPGA